MGYINFTFYMTADKMSRSERSDRGDHSMESFRPVHRLRYIHSNNSEQVMQDGELPHRVEKLPCFPLNDIFDDSG